MSTPAPNLHDLTRRVRQVLAEHDLEAHSVSTSSQGDQVYANIVFYREPMTRNRIVEEPFELRKRAEPLSEANIERAAQHLGDYLHTTPYRSFSDGTQRH